MKKNITFIILITISILLIAFSQIIMNNEAYPTTNNEELLVITGEIIELESGRFLLQSSYKVWIASNSMDSLKIGQTVSVWVNFVETSDPAQAQASATKIEIKTAD